MQTENQDRCSTKQKNESGSDRGGNGLLCTDRWRETGKDEAIDLVLGNNQKINIVEALAEYAENKPGHGSHVIKINQTKEYEELSIDHTAEHVRAYIKVQDGCNQFCTYCIIPYARGRVRSRNIESVLKEVRALAEKGIRKWSLQESI